MGKREPCSVVEWLGHFPRRAEASGACSQASFSIFLDTVIKQNSSGTREWDPRLSPP